MNIIKERAFYLINGAFYNQNDTFDHKITSDTILYILQNNQDDDISTYQP